MFDLVPQAEIFALKSILLLWLFVYMSRFYRRVVVRWGSGVKFPEPLPLLKVAPWLSKIADPKIYSAFVLTVLLAASGFLIGYLETTSALILFLAALILGTAANSFGKIYHSLHIVVWLLFGFTFAHFSYGSGERFYFNLLSVVYFLIGMQYFLSAVSKAASGHGLKNWLSGESLKAAILLRHLENIASDGMRPLSKRKAFLIYTPGIAAVTSWWVLLAEFSGLFLFIAPPVVKLLTLSSLFAMHMGAWAFMDVKFRESISILALLVIVQLEKIL